MFGGKDDKMNLKEASLTAVQGFPEEANTKTIYDIVAELRAEDQARERRVHNATSEDHNEVTVQSSSVTKDLIQRQASGSQAKREVKEYDSVPSKTPNRSEYATAVVSTKS